ncbi:hypothetical protein E6P09_18745 (plasmid) [Haloferax mediterranei ATCC 33500]|uniref:DUF7260 domain-containing protein n=1 Tax=Haloferax mediterranei (strain ATCC 33500 / DSM 1411 / JCM 8866 / NBRC 14739 / NCIMB 2177 / R-4) TaxID=523841 RepID=I3R9K9_HALMT|nr:hypothetical protein [Haloferax mediterranei]AFK20919.1 hypothetical protein HFX_5084 [Haloferax mediterranei ATCC 33500]AHZ24211.1 hypothetical protein BM92_18590 [Haloferax mediterranei ATCC 33500]EMA05290.1 hypothetical protein C439_00785 [Haloferax mediterranei ATCC 33500]MDX5989908.1 hypothetical protein [Haloferax mediterranei ATCC 33500]QCQ77349.1 hypothetical protein E6P09_18745 [Haloferax mediterranei ATCC 33500]
MNRFQRLYDALDRISCELEHIVQKSKAVDEFRASVRNFPAHSERQAVSAPQATTGQTAAVTNRPFQAGAHADCCRQIRTAFEETVRPHSVVDVEANEPLLTTIREELGAEIAIALAPNSGTTYSSELRNAVIASATARRAELQSMEQALAAERESVETALADMKALVDDEDPDKEAWLLYWSFDELRSYYEEVALARKKCERMSQRRQRDVHGTAASNAQARVSHDSLAEYLYGDFQTNYPVLATVVELDTEYADRQREIRDQLTRRV